MKKDVVILLGSSDIGGGQKVAIDLFNYLRERKNLNVEFLNAFQTKAKKYHIQKKCIVNQKLNSKFLKYFYLVLRLKFFLLKKPKGTVLITFMPHMNYIGIICKNKNIDVLITEHNIQSPIYSKKRNIIMNLLSLFLYKKAKKTISVSKGVSIHVKKKSKVKSIIIPNYVNPAQQVKNFHESKNILLLGRLHYQKGFDDALHIFANSKLYNSKYRLKIYGEGPEKKSLISLSNNLAISKHVDFCKPSENIDYIFSKARVMLFMSRWEGFGLTFSESLIRGIPIIGYACKSGPDEIQKTLKIRGVSFSRNINLATNNLLKEIKYPSKIEKLSIFRKKIIDMYSHKNTHDKYLELINNDRK